MKNTNGAVLGIDVGGTGIKGAPVDLKSGKLLAERFRIDTPQPADPDAVCETVGEVVRHFKWNGLIGCTLPSVVRRGVVFTAANIDPAWIGINAVEKLSRVCRNPVAVLNDADAAGIAEMRFGAGRSEDGLALIVTLGTGIGTALFYRGMLVPNSELGHLEIGGKDAERVASNRVREKKDLSWKAWAKNVNRYLKTLEELLWPDLFIIGGGVSKKAENFLPRLSLKSRVVPAKLLNDAGIVGAALAAHEELSGRAMVVSSSNKSRGTVRSGKRERRTARVSA